VNQASDAPLVLHVIHHLVIGGMENGLVNLINHMPERTYRHAIACVEDYSDFRQRIVRPDIEVFALRRSRIGVWGMRRELFRLCRRLRPAIVHTRNQSGLDALLPARLAGVRHTVHGEHGWDVGDIDGRQWKPALLRRLHAPLVSRYVTVSQDLERYLIKRIGIRSSRIAQIYNGVDIERFLPARPRPRSAFPAGFVDANSFVIGTVGRLQRVKDQVTLLRAFARLHTDRPEWHDRLRLVVVGDGPLAAELHSIADQLGIAGSTWFAGAQHDVSRLLQGFDLFVLPSLNEGISNTILEAMACGLPILATAIGGNVELVRDGDCGRHFATGDVAFLADLLAVYVARPELGAEQGRAARARVEQAFSLDAMTRGYIALYDRLLERSASAAP
jgi:sugar transferase (PEP-CTERM/EpsH1 system associated)